MVGEKKKYPYIIHCPVQFCVSCVRDFSPRGRELAAAEVVGDVAEVIAATAVLPAVTSCNHVCLDDFRVKKGGRESIFRN